MNRADLLRAAELARAAADAATIAASFDRIKPDQAERYRRQSEEACYAAIEALFEADLSAAPASSLPALIAECFPHLSPALKTKAA